MRGDEGGLAREGRRGRYKSDAAGLRRWHVSATPPPAAPVLGGEVSAFVALKYRCGAECVGETRSCGWRVTTAHQRAFQQAMVHKAVAGTWWSVRGLAEGRYRKTRLTRRWVFTLMGRDGWP